MPSSTSMKLFTSVEFESVKLGFEFPARLLNSKSQNSFSIFERKTHQ